MAKREKKRAPRRLWPLLIGSVFFGVVAALLAAAYLQSLERALLARLEPVKEREIDVAVAAQDLERGAVVSIENFQKLSVPARYVHSDVVTPEEFSQYEGRAITVPLGAGKPLLRSHLDEDFPIDFSDIVDKGRRAITVTVDELSSINGFIRPGNRIDLFVNIALEESGVTTGALAAGFQKVGLKGFGDVDGLQQALRGLPEEVSADEIKNAFLPNDVIIPVLQDIRVLATGSEPYLETLDKLRQPQPRRERSYTTLTLDVTARQAAFISAALDKGDLIAMLRNRNDRSLADFSSVSAQELFGNAERMAREAEEAARKVGAVAGVTRGGDLLGADGKIVATREQLAAAGFKLDENGNIIDKDGNIVHPSDLVVTSDGQVVSRQQLAAAGMRVDAQGRIVDAAGNVVEPGDLVVTRDGKVLRRDQLAQAGLSVNDKGEIVDATGRVLSGDEVVMTEDGRLLQKKDVVVGMDGRIMTREQLAQAGLSVDKNGNIVDAQGNVVSPDDLVVTADGRVVKTTDAVVAADGRVFAKADLERAGLHVDENGNIVDASGKVVDPASLVVSADGKVLTEAQAREQGVLAAVAAGVNADGALTDASGKVLATREQLAAAGYTVNDKGQIVDKDGNVV
ncbi:MAG: Flp pilus assembly protein CpaB, partial [Gammaproteobacteria bacterium]|nr:Flp pilus assembly protein CpaB [Gammaproteobacteria bacterium]